MGLFDFLKRLFGQAGSGTDNLERSRQRLIERGGGMGVDILAQRLGVGVEQLRAVTPAYRQFTIPKRSGGKRVILAPEPNLKQLQRTILRRLLARLRSHPAATGFERGYSIVRNAAVHTGSYVVLKMDLKEFFTSTSDRRVLEYFYALGWGEEAADLLVRLCTHNGGLPQGAPTSPRLSNLVNYGLDVRLFGLARNIGAVYTRYADDITFSFKDFSTNASSPAARRALSMPAGAKHRERSSIVAAIRVTKKIVSEYGYRLHQKRKLSIRRRYQSQRVTGLVVNERVALPRETRRRLRAAAHHLKTGREASLTPEQLAGWDALAHMIETQRQDSTQTDF